MHNQDNRDKNSTTQSGSFVVGINNGLINAETIIGTSNQKEQSQSLKEAVVEIQQLLDQLSKTYSPEEAEQKAAEELADRAKQNPSFKENLETWSNSLLGKGSETAVTEVVKEGVKRVIPLAMTMLV